MNANYPSIRVLGSRIHLVSVDDIIANIAEWIDTYQQGKPCRQIVVTGFHGIWEAHQRPDFKAILNAADLWAPDGIAPVWIARLKGFKKVYRTPGADIMQAFFQEAQRKGYKSFFYGDTDETLEALKKNLNLAYPNHQTVGVFSPPFRPLTAEEDDAIIAMINNAKPDVIWVGLGLPKQDRWIGDRKNRLNAPVAIGVGAAFGFLSGKVKWVPRLVGESGFEWLWRFIQEPKKLWRRDLLDGPRFIVHVILELLGLKRYD
jgi:N-acetylglucosaminyldiphosphoundecaprenol N-acetyl-beta-D-mannosaminyltransferase